MHQKYGLKDIESILGDNLTVKGCHYGKYFTNLRPVWTADRDSLVFIGSEEGTKQLINETNAEMIMCNRGIKIDEVSLDSKLLILVESPKLAIARIGNTLFKPSQVCGIHLSASIRSSACIHTKSYIGPFCSIGRSEVGEGTVIVGQCYVYDDVEIGKNVTIQPGSVIGASATAGAAIKNEEGLYEDFPQLGRVVSGTMYQ